MKPLHNQVALVTGASRGAGRGIAAELGAAGATVYVTGRSVAGGPTTDNVPGTIDDTAREVTARGGRGIAIRCDHTVDAEVDAVFAQIRSDHGRLDLLVNNVWGGYEHSECKPLPLVPFWEQSLHQWDGMFTAGVRAHVTASRLAAPLMVPHRRGLIVSTTANLGRASVPAESFLRSLEERGRPSRLGDGAGARASMASRRWPWRRVSCGPNG